MIKFDQKIFLVESVLFDDKRHPEKKRSNPNHYKNILGTEKSSTPFQTYAETKLARKTQIHFFVPNLQKYQLSTKKVLT